MIRSNQYFPTLLLRQGVDLLNFPSQPSFLSLIQGPLTVLGSDSPDVPPVADPLMLPGETDKDEFNVPDGYTVDRSAFDAIESKQVNLLIIYNLDVRGTLPSIGTLTSDQFYGMNMGQNLVISGVEQRDGIVYGDMNLLEIYLGGGVDHITVINTTEALHLLHTGGGDDNILVKSVSGPFFIQGGEGNDTVTVASNVSTLDGIQALLAFDGGADYGDSLSLDNSGDSKGADPVLNLTRNVIEVESMAMPGSSKNAPREVYLISLLGATAGSYALEITESLNSTVFSQNLTVPPNTTADALEVLIQDTLFPEAYKASCGLTGETACSQSVKVYEMGAGFLISFIGESKNTGVSLRFLTDNLANFQSEMFQNSTNDILKKPSDVVYGNVEVLNVAMGANGTVLNIRGTSANTSISTQSSDDYVFISSEANQNLTNAGAVDVLHGWLDYMHGDLTVKVGSGRQRLMISDESSNISMASKAEPAVLSKSSLTSIKDNVGNIYFSAEGGNWSRGVNLWLGRNDDYLNVVSIPSNEGETILRTTTSIHAGSGHDVLSVALDGSKHNGAVFIANGQAGNDVINGSLSSLPLILFGDGGDDVLESGSGADVVFGDYGRVYWVTTDGNTTTTVASAGAGGYGDFTDGVVRTISEIVSVATSEGGWDTLILNAGDDVGIGGYRNDSLEGGDGRDILFGDAAQVYYYASSTSPHLLISIDCEAGGDDTLYGGAGDVDYIVGGGFADEIWGGTNSTGVSDGCDLVFGDHAQILLFEDPPFKLLKAETIFANCTGGNDRIFLGGELLVPMRRCPLVLCLITCWNEFRSWG
jgi:Ca2+-binding RTX toxin-like protein